MVGEDNTAAELKGFDPVQVALMQEECILVDKDDKVIGHDSKKNCMFPFFSFIFLSLSFLSLLFITLSCFLLNSFCFLFLFCISSLLQFKLTESNCPVLNETFNIYQIYFINSEVRRS